MVQCVAAAAAAAEDRGLQRPRRQTTLICTNKKLCRSGAPGRIGLSGKAARAFRSSRNRPWRNEAVTERTWLPAEGFPAEPWAQEPWISGERPSSNGTLDRGRCFMRDTISACRRALLPASAAASAPATARQRRITAAAARNWINDEAHALHFCYSSGSPSRSLFSCGADSDPPDISHPAAMGRRSCPRQPDTVRRTRFSCACYMSSCTRRYVQACTVPRCIPVTSALRHP